ncbi:hypothetical protein [Streptomyces umbrinus]|uniref:hypothetical protein n=1 Tax=Streptomyces umbrinus TaxID=67370 RepID=UPI0033D998F4
MDMMHGMPETVEIRVHGVSGTAAESLLEISSVEQVAGDDTARFMRRAQVPPPAGPTQVEAFHWGTMTSGSVSKALWLLMAPFSVINLARFTLPMTAAASGGRDKIRGVADVALRLLGLVMTAMLVTTVAFVSIDLVAWQCGGASGCQHHNLSFFGPELIEWRWRLLLGMTVPAATVALLAAMSAQVYLYGSPGATQETPDAVGSLGDRKFWSPSPQTALLRRLHLSAALAVVAMLVAHLSTHEMTGLVPAHGWSRRVLWVLFGLSALIALLCVVITGRGRTLFPSYVNAVENPRAVPRFYRGLTVGAWFVFVAVTVIAVGWGSRAARPRGIRPARLTGFDWAFQVHFAAAAVLLIILFGANVALRGPTYTAPEGLRPMWRGMACSVLTGFAVLLAAGFTAGIALQSARLFGWENYGSGLKEPLDVPDLFRVTAVLWGLLALILLVVAVVVLVPYYLRGGTPLATRIAQDYPAGELSERTLQRMSAAWRRARLKYRLPYILLTLGALGWAAALLQGALGVRALVPGRDPGYGWIEEHVYGTGWREGVWRGVEELVGTWVLTALAALLVFLGARAFRSPAWRRSVGVLWDLLAFWPRLTHPIVPPPYGGHAVLSLAHRSEEVIGSGRNVVLSGHSQGSVICMAAALTVEPVTRKGMAMVTHGSQLLWAYSRLFPAYLGYDQLADLYANQLAGRWCNVHRWTDYLGGPVLARPATAPFEPALPDMPQGSAWVAIDGAAAEHEESDESADGGGWLRRFGPEYQLRDPFHAIAQGGGPVSPILAHSAYYADPAYDRIVAQLLAPFTAGGGDNAVDGGAG